MQRKFEVKYMNYGIANRYSGYYIEMHKKLLRPEYSELYKEILEHEKAHSEGEWTYKDIELDLKGFKNKWLYWKFILTTPSSWLQFLPLYPSRGKIYYDFSVMWLWLFGLMILAAIILFIW